MLKKMCVITLGLVVIISLTSCTSNKNSGKNSLEIQQPTSSSTKGEKGNTEINTPGSNDIAVSMNNYLTNQNFLEFEGVIGSNMAITVQLHTIPAQQSLSHPAYELETESSIIKNIYIAPIMRYEGVYYYKKYHQNINITAFYYSNNYFAIVEFNGNNQYNGSFSGFIDNDNIIKGTWSDNQGNIKFPFYLAMNSSNTLKVSFRPDFQRIGHYKKIYSTSDSGANLTIETELNDRFKFNLTGNWNYNVGEVDGIAIYTNNTKSKSEYYNEKDGLKIDFNFSDGNVNVTANNIINNYSGMNVSLVGRFQKQP